MKGLNVYKPRYKIPYQAKTKVFLYKDSRLRRFFNIRGWKIVRRGLFKRLVVVLNNMKWTVARRYIRPFAKRRKSARRERQYIRLFQNKQQLRHFYGKFKEESFRNLFRAHLVGVYARNNTFYSKLESRVDMFLFRSRNFPTLYSANQYVFHQGIEYDGVKYNSPNAVIGPGNSLIFDEDLWDLFFENLFDKIDYRYFGKELLEKRKHYKLRKKIRYFLRRRKRWNRNRILYIKLIRKIWHMQAYIPILLKVLFDTCNNNEDENNNEKDTNKKLPIKKPKIEKSLFQKLKIDLENLKEEALLLKKDFITAMKYKTEGNKSFNKLNKDLLKKKYKNIIKNKNNSYNKWMKKTVKKNTWRYKRWALKQTKQLRGLEKINASMITSKFADKKKVKRQIYNYLRLTIKFYIKIASFIIHKKKQSINQKINFVDQNLINMTESLPIIQEDLIRTKKNIKKIKIKKDRLTKSLNKLKEEKLNIIETKEEFNQNLRFNFKYKKYIIKSKKNFITLKNTLKILKKKTKIRLKKINLNNVRKLIRIYSKIKIINLKKIKLYKKNIIRINKRNKKLIYKKNKKIIIKKYKNKTIIKIKKKIKKKHFKKYLKNVKGIFWIKKNKNKNLIKRIDRKKNRNYFLNSKFKNKIKIFFFKRKIFNKKIKIKRISRILNYLNLTKIKLRLNRLQKNRIQKLKLKKKIILKLNLLRNHNIKLKINNNNILPFIFIKDIKKNNKQFRITKQRKAIIRKRKFYNIKIKKISQLQKHYIFLYRLNRRRKSKLKYYRKKNIKRIKALIALKLHLEKQEDLLTDKLAQITEKSTQLINNYIDSLRIKQRYKRWKIRWAEKIELKKDTIEKESNISTIKKKKEYEYKIWKNNIHYNFIKRRRKRRKRRRSSRFRRVHWYIPSYIHFDFESMVSLMTHAPKPKEIFYAFKASLTKLHAFYRSRGL